MRNDMLIYFIMKINELNFACFAGSKLFASDLHEIETWKSITNVKVEIYVTDGCYGGIRYYSNFQLVPNLSNYSIFPLFSYLHTW